MGIKIIFTILIFFVGQIFPAICTNPRTENYVSDTFNLVLGGETHSFASIESDIVCNDGSVHRYYNIGLIGKVLVEYFLAMIEWEGKSYEPIYTNGEICNHQENPNWKKVSTYSGCLPRPILFVHGINASQTTWGAQFPQNADLDSYNNGKISGYNSNRAVQHIANYYGTNGNINHNGLEFYNATDGEGLNKFLTTDPTINSEYDQTNLFYNRLVKILDEYYGDNWKTNEDLKVDIISHSQGGLVTRSAIGYFRDPSISNPLNHINSIVTMDTPHLGAAIANDDSDYDQVEYIRSFIIGNYEAGNFGPIPFMDGEIDPFKSIRKALDDFTVGDDVLGANTSFIQGLRSYGYPYSRGKSIPMVALYGVAENLGEKIADFALTTALDHCMSIDIEIDPCEGGPWYERVGCGVLDLVGDAFEGGMSLMISSSNLFLNGEFDWISLDELAQQSCGVSLPLLMKDIVSVLPWLDEVWSNKSDFIVEIPSQQGTGLFYEGHHPFLTKKIDPMPGNEGLVTHLGLIGFAGAANHYQDIIWALENMPETKSRGNGPASVYSQLLLR